MDISIGAIQAKKISVGDLDIAKVSVGDVLVWPPAPTVPIYYVYTFNSAGTTKDFTIPTGVARMGVCIVGDGGSGFNRTSANGGSGGGGGALAWLNVNVAVGEIYLVGTDDNVQLALMDMNGLTWFYAGRGADASASNFGAGGVAQFFPGRYSSRSPTSGSGAGGAGGLGGSSGQSGGGGGAGGYSGAGGKGSAGGGLGGTAGSGGAGGGGTGGVLAGEAGGYGGSVGMMGAGSSGNIGNNGSIDGTPISTNLVTAGGGGFGSFNASTGFGKRGVVIVRYDVADYATYVQSTPANTVTINTLEVPP